jgi:hypothetical protein
MTEIRYAPGALRAIVAGRGVAVLGEGATDAATLAIRDRLAAGEGFGAVVDALAAGGSLANLPAFVVVVDEGAAWRVSVRGGLSAVVTTASGIENIDGSAASTWSERSILGVTRLSVAHGTGEDAASARLPIADGVVLAAVVVVSASGAAAGESKAAPSALAVPAAPAEPVQPHSVAEVRDEEAPVESEPAEPESAAPNPVEPESEPGPIEPEPVEPEPIEPEPAEPEPAEPEPAEPEPAEPEPIEPEPAAPEPAAPEPAEPEPAEPEPAEPEPAEPEPFESEPVESEFEPAGPGSTAPEPAAPIIPPLPAIPPPPPLPRADDGVLIDSIPPFPRAATPPVPQAPPAAAPADAAAAATEDLEATTVVGRPLRGRSTAPQPAAELPQGDHDGETLSLEEARRLRAGGALPAPAPTPAPVAAPVAPLGRLRLSTGQIVLLDRTVIIGRRPGSSRASGAEMPHLIGVDSPQQDISRNHIEVRAEGDSILVTDLRTTNGTTLLRQGSVPTRLHPGEPTIVVSGDVLDLGDGVKVAIETPAVESPA